MTRATLLHVLDRPTALGPDEVRELEQLAQAFPYCQTAHLLLAKAAHDQGTMLAGQRLRRAATYAADRTLLRRLIEQLEPMHVAAPAAPEPSAAPTVPAAAPPEIVTVVETEAPAAVEVSAAVEIPAAVTAPLAPTAEVVLPAIMEPVQAQFTSPPVAEVARLAASISEPLVSQAPVIEEAAPEAFSAPPAQVEVEAEVPVEPSAAPVVEIALAPESPSNTAPTATTAGPADTPPLESSTVPTEAEAPAAVLPVPTNEAPTAPEITAEPTAAAAVETELPPAEPVTPVLLELEGACIPVSEAVGELVPEPLTGVWVELPEPAMEADLPAQAPAIRPPAEVGAARFEYGLVKEPAPASPAYEFPGLVDEFAASAVTLSMGGPELPAAALSDAAGRYAPFTPAAFTGDATVGYALGESSRLGLSMQLLDLLAAQAEAAETATAVVAAAQPPATALPPTGTFFEPDPLLLDHWATHCPPPTALPSSFDLINNFLKRQPRLTRPGMLPPAPGGQADLSARSTRAEPDLVSENLARIFVRQGKIVRAVEIYEKLMVKHPEKITYFAAQIQSLQPSA